MERGAWDEGCGNVVHMVGWDDDCRSGWHPCDDLCLSVSCRMTSMSRARCSTGTLCTQVWARLAEE